MRACEIFLWALLAGIGFLVLQAHYIGKQGQGVGDSIAKTYVVRSKDLTAWWGQSTPSTPSGPNPPP